MNRGEADIGEVPDKVGVEAGDWWTGGSLVSLAQAKAHGVFHPLSPATLSIQQELKRQFDPAGIFNPGRLYPGL